MGVPRATWHVWKLRPEECLYDVHAGLRDPQRIYHGMLRLAVTAAVAALFVWFVRRKPLWSRLSWIRERAPFLFCIAIYTNLHDTIAFVNSHDTSGTSSTSRSRRPRPGSRWRLSSPGTSRAGG